MADNSVSNDPASLELSPVEMQAMGDAVVARSVAHLAALDQIRLVATTATSRHCAALRGL